MATYSLTWTGVSAVAMARLIRMAGKAGLTEPMVGIDGQQTVWTVSVASFGANKIATIKAIRELTGMGLKEAKDVSEGCAGGVVEKECSARRVDEIRKVLTEAGATVTVS